MGSEAVAVREEIAGVAVYLKADPDRVLAEAHKAAVALQGVIASKKKKVEFNGRQYIESEDWITLGRFYDVTGAAEGEPAYVEMGGHHGFKATFVALRGGEVISRATAFCMDDEEKWGARPKYAYHVHLKAGGTCLEDEAPSKNEWVWEPNPNKPGSERPKKSRVQIGTEAVPLFQLASMAQTRACSKVLAQVLKWVVVLAGYAPTPAEEIQDMDGARTVVDAEVMAREPGSDDDDQAAAAYRKHDVAPPAQSGPLPACPKCKAGNKAVIKSKLGAPGELVCWKKSTRATGCGNTWIPGATSPADEPGAAEGAAALA